VILVGHSYGGVVISSTGDDPKVVGLVYICAFAADTGESVSKANAWLERTKPVFCSSSSDNLPEKTITWGLCSSLKTPTRQFTSQLPRLGFQQRP
jgi:hypothetical protein